MIKTIVFIWVIYLISGSSNCYAFQRIQPLDTGDTLPDLAITIKKGDSIRSGYLSDYKGKLLLLDYWGVHCLDCIASMPHMLELQNQFKDSFQIILVTENNEEQIQNLLKKFEKKPFAKDWVKAGIQLPFIMNDSVISKLIPYNSLPTHVWIDGNRVIRAVTYSTTTTAENIRNFLEGKTVELDMQRLRVIDMEAPLSWVNEDLVFPDDVRYYSFLSNHIEFGRGGFTWSRPIVDTIFKKIVGFKCLNSSLLSMYRQAYEDILKLKPIIPRNRIIIETDDTLKFVPPGNTRDGLQWAKGNTFCYALKVPVLFSSRVYATMRSDLDRFFQVSSSVQKRKVKCMILRRVSADDRIHTRGLAEQYESDSAKLLIKNMGMEQLFLSLNTVMGIKFPSLVFINETNYKDNIDIEIPWKKNPREISIAVLRKSLQFYGLDVVAGYRYLDMLVIKDRAKLLK